MSRLSEAGLKLCWGAVPFDQWFSQDMGQGLGMSDPSFNLYESFFFTGIQKMSVMLTVARVYSQGFFSRLSRIDLL